MTLYSKINKILFIVILLITALNCFGSQNQRTKTDSIIYYVEKNKPLKAISFARKESESSLLNKNYNHYCDVMIRKSEIFRNINDYENALNTLYEALAIAEKNNLKSKQCLIYRGIGNLNGLTFEFTKAKKYLHKALKIAKTLNDNDLLSKANQGLLRIHYETGSDSVDYYLKKIAYYSSKSNDLYERFKNYSNFSKIYLDKGNPDGKKYLDSAYIFAKKIGRKDNIANTLNDLGVYYMNILKDNKKALEAFFQVLKLYPNSENSKILSVSYSNISYAYEQMGDYKKALEYNNKYYDLFSEISSGRLNAARQEIETKYQIKKIEDEFKEKQSLIEERQARNQKLLLLFASIFILAGFIFYFYYQNLLLKQKNKIKDLDNDLQYKIISATLDGQDQERNKISGILHDHVSAILSSVGLHLSAFESSLTKEQIEDLKKTRSLLKDAHDKVRDLSHELVPPLLVKLGLQYALKDLCENNSNSLLSFEFHSTLAREKRFHPDFENRIYFIVSELLNNIIKHSEATNAKLSIEELGDKLHITIEDNGKGFNTNNINKSNGFGLTQIRARVNNMNGKMKIKSEPNKGTIINITVDE
ncbi:Tetratricopeptide repeat-containing protein [Flavobacterium terrae]|uniref:histidine kinase n=1 Tax=Flavobacterium terrae TaxID=415425 RepID=A0A1M6GXB0_9FLAO|nr:Tetratricopeptide repeat-containing protein [Flavobacterium terrae]